jgi:hypothetical protein
MQAAALKAPENQSKRGRKNVDSALPHQRCIFAYETALLGLYAHGRRVHSESGSLQAFGGEE